MDLEYFNAMLGKNATKDDTVVGADPTAGPVIFAPNEYKTVAKKPVHTVDKGAFIKTYSGVNFFPFDPKVEDVNIVDIAHALALQCRFNGHTNRFYSVAQHCIEVAKKCSPENQLWGLLHDAPEAYISDLASPIKKNMPEFQKAEATILRVIVEKYRLHIDTGDSDINPLAPNPYFEPKEVKAVDTRMLVTEARDLLGLFPNPWGMDVEPFSDTVLIPMSPEKAEREYIRAFEELLIRGKMT